jgi:starch synthase
MRVTVIDLWGREAMLHYVSQLANNLTGITGVEVTVLLPNGSDTSLFKSMVRVDFLNVVKDASISQMLSVPYKLAQLPRFFQTIHRTRPDVLHLNNCHVWYIFTLPWLKRQYPIISTLHDVEPHPGLDNTWRKRKEIDTIARYSDRIFVHGEALKQKLHAKYLFLAPHQTNVIPIGDFSFLTEFPTNVTEEANVALFFGRIRAYKGLEYFLEAAAIVTRAIPNARFIIAGEGDLQPYQKWIGDRSNFEIINRYTPDHQVAALFKRASIVVLPYTQASQSGVIPVAYAFEKPVVTTQVGCLSEVVEDGRTGLIVPPGDAPALAEAMLRLFQNDELRKSLGRNAYQKMKDELGWDKIASTTVNIYKKVIEEFRQHNPKMK